MSYNFIRADRNQTYLLPPNIKEWLPENDLAWFLLDAVERMDLSGFYRKYREDGHGRAAYEPSMMVSLLLYAYCLGEQSSRRIERLCVKDVGFRVVAANHQPNFTTICRFRRENEKELADLFGQVLSLCNEAGLVDVGVVALDGTKMKADASLDKNRTHQSIKELVEKMFREAERIDEEEDRLFGEDKRGDELPEELADPARRRAILDEGMKRLDKEAKERAAEQQAKIDKREAEEKESGRKKRGRKPKKPDPAPSKEAKANITDPKSRIMKTRRGFIQGYNAQAMVTKDQIILAAEVTQQENDVRQLHPMIEATKRNLDPLSGEHRIETVLADAGYCSEENLKRAETTDQKLLVAVCKDHKLRQAQKNDPATLEPLPDSASHTERMERELLTEEGRELYKLRSQTVEPVFGQIKSARGLDGFMRRGTDAVDSEWKIIALAHNLLKLHCHGVRVARNIKEHTLMGRGKVILAGV